MYGTFTDLLCILVLVWALAVEGKRLLDPFFLGQGLKQQLKALPLYLLALAPFVGGSALVAYPFYQGALPGQIAVIDLLLWATTYSVAVWPLIWAFTEQLFYLGYLLPRLEQIFGNRWFAALLVILFWAGQHVVIPSLADPKYLISRLLTALVVVSGMVLVYIWLQRRLLTTTLIHWLADAPTALIPIMVTAVL